MPSGTPSGAVSATAHDTTAAPPRLRTRPLSRDCGGDARSVELAESMEAHQRAISVHQGAMVTEIAEFARSEAFRGDGALSMAAWLSDRCQVSAASAATLVAVAEKLGGLPQLSAALSAGRLTLDVLAPVATVATPETDASLAEAAVHWSVRQAHDLARSARGMKDADAAKKFIGRFTASYDAQNPTGGSSAPPTVAMLVSQPGISQSLLLSIANLKMGGS